MRVFGGFDGAIYMNESELPLVILVVSSLQPSLPEYPTLAEHLTVTCTQPGREQTGRKDRLDPSGIWTGHDLRNDGILYLPSACQPSVLCAVLEWNGPACVDSHLPQRLHAGSPQWQAAESGVSVLCIQIL